MSADSAGPVPRIAVVAALQREIAPLVRGWKQRELGRHRVYESPRAIAVCGGVGFQAATHAAEALVAEYNPALLISAGFAGSLARELKAGETMLAAQVKDAESGRNYQAKRGDATLVSAAGIANPEDKRWLAEKYSARAVDMEAAAVAGVAARRGISFLAAKAISDEIEFTLPPVTHFVDAEGGFSTMRFLMHILVRPHLWSSVYKLQRSTSKARQALCALLRNLIEQEAGAAGAVKSEVESTAGH